MTRENRSFRHVLIRTILVTLGVAALGGCGAVHHAAQLESGFLPKPDMRIEVGPVTNATAQTSEIDVSQHFAAALGKALEKKDLLWTEGKGSERLVLTTKIVEYEEGHAFKRWLLPGWGSTVLSIQGDLKEQTSGKIIGSVEARRSISFGGLYTIGAWMTIFPSVAEDVVDELQSKLRQ